MKSFLYKARDTSGRLVSGTTDAENNNEAVEILRGQGLLPVSIREKKQIELFFQSKKVPASEIIVFTKQLASLLKVGVPFLTAILIIKEDVTNDAFNQILSAIVKDLEQGSFFSDALAKFENIFGMIYVSMVKTGEAGGTLEHVLERLAVLGERETEIKAQITAALSYPIMVICMMITAFITIITFVIPRFSKVYARAGVDLPLPTKILIALNRMAVSYWYLFIIAGIGFVIGWRYFINTPKGRLFWDRLKIKFPLVGGLVLRIILARFSRIISILSSAGVKIVTILELCKDAVANKVLSNAIADMITQLKEGESFSAAVKKSGLFPPIVVQMIAAGEESGKIDELLGFVAQYYDTRVDYGVKTLVRYIEPALIFVLALGVLFIALGVFMPMWNFIQIFKH